MPGNHLHMHPTSTALPCCRGAKGCGHRVSAVAVARMAGGFTCALLLMWEMSAATPSVPTTSYKLSSLTRGFLRQPPLLIPIHIYIGLRRHSWYVWTLYASTNTLPSMSSQECTQMQIMLLRRPTTAQQQDQGPYIFINRASGCPIPPAAPVCTHDESQKPAVQSAVRVLASFSHT